MARYIDADALKTDILKKYKQNWEVPCSYEDRIIQRVVTDLRVLIEQNTPADVVPKSEVEKIFEAVDSMLELVCAATGLGMTFFGKYAELKKKYTEEKG